MTAVEIYRVAGEKTPHDVSQTVLAWMKQEVNMIGHQRPGKALGLCVEQQEGKMLDKSLPILVVFENFAAIDAPHNDVLEKTRKI